MPDGLRRGLRLRAWRTVRRRRRPRLRSARPVTDGIGLLQHPSLRRRYGERRYRPRRGRGLHPRRNRTPR
ncbi:hypothetical protein SZ63_01520 [Methanoculleus sediminis]|uniref:Uncharacterized protein n=1 Tax=Methanoculleus sediminis TaxID=1550566 RepID=A0A0H1R265_9EURY|nr:hypothetical protein SZ63_01520 [Methanoculleus sediminis]